MTADRLVLAAGIGLVGIGLFMFCHASHGPNHLAYVPAPVSPPSQETFLETFFPPEATRRPDPQQYTVYTSPAAESAVFDKYFPDTATDRFVLDGSGGHIEDNPPQPTTVIDSYLGNIDPDCPDDWWQQVDPSTQYVEWR